MAILKRNTRQALDKARAEYAQAEARIGEINQQRQAVLVDADAEVDALLVLDRQLVEQSDKLAALSARIEMLSGRLDGEVAEQRRADREKAVAKVVALLPKRRDAAMAFEDAVRGVAIALERLDQAQRKIVSDWPAEIEKPWAFFFDTSRAEHALFEAVLSCDPNWKWGGALSDKLVRIRERITGFAEDEDRHHADWLEHLRQAAPQSRSESEAA
jgi:multidrug efflux pump subunit AcrA (membrane-fusion protein)